MTLGDQYKDLVMAAPATGSEVTDLNIPKTIVSFADDNFDNFTIGEISGQGAWVEESASTDIYMVTSAQSYIGSQCLFVDNDAADDALLRIISPQTGTFGYSFYVRTNDAAGNTPRMGFFEGDAAGGWNGPYFRINGNDIQNFDGLSWQDITTGDLISSDTWYKISGTVDITSDTFTLFVNDTQYGTNHDFRDDQDHIDEFGITTGGSTSGDDLYIDGLRIYQANADLSFAADGARHIGTDCRKNDRIYQRPRPHRPYGGHRRSDDYHRWGDRFDFSIFEMRTTL